MKSIVILVFGLLTVCAYGRATVDDFIYADGDTYFFKEVRFGSATTRIKTADGSLIKIATDKIKAYSLKGRQYEFLPTVNCVGDTLGYAFMELIATRNGSRLFRYCSNCNRYDPLNEEINPINRVYRYYVVKKDRIKLITCSAHFKSLMEFFHIKIKC